MYKIGEFSNLSRITSKTLHYYDEVGLFKPLKINKENGYRYYSAEQLPKLYRIVSLREFGFSINEIMEFINSEGTDNQLTSLLEQKRIEMDEQLQSCQRKIKQIDSYIKLLANEEQIVDYNVVIKEVPQMIVASSRREFYDYSEFNDKIIEIEAFIKAQKISVGNPNYCFTIYHDCEYKESNIDAEICQVVSKFGQNSGGIEFKNIPSIETAACILHYQSHNLIRQSYGHLIKWVNQNGYEIAGELRECYIDKILSNNNNNNAVIEIQAPIAKSK